MSLLVKTEELTTTQERLLENGMVVGAGYKELCGTLRVYDGIEATGGVVEPLDQEIPQMKELLLIHLDFIQQQSEQLATKDKMITDLKNENEMLKLRIERMERRVSLQKQQSKQQGGGAENGGDRAGAVGGQSAPGGTAAATADGRKRRRRSADGGKKGGGKKACMDVASALQRTTPRTEARRNSKRHRQGESEERHSPINKDLYLMTQTSYYTTIGEQECMWGYEARTTHRTTTLEVPKWRLKIYTSSYTMEGTENLSDDVFDRRHFRLAIDEKRRKRWDVQRIREQRQNEKLRQREKMRQGGEGTEEAEPDSFWPHPHPRLTLCVDDSIPVTVFGIPIPNTPVTEFSLPWLSGREPNNQRHRQLSRKSKR